MHAERVDALGAYRDSDDLTLLTLVNVVLRHRRLIILFAALVAGVMAALTLVKKRTYTSAARFIPQNSQPVSPLAGVAAQFGVNFATSAGNTPAFYVSLAKSSSVLGMLMDTTITVPTSNGPKSGTIPDHLEIEAANPTTRRSFAIGDLQARINAGHDLATSIVSISVTTENPHLSRTIVDVLLRAINRFNLENRQSQAGAERRFAEQRLAEIRGEMRQAEDALLSFLERNRVIAAPELVAQRERLQRDVALRTTMYTTMMQAHEQAKLEEVRDTPVITVLEHPAVAIFPDPRGLVTKTLLAFLVGLLLAIAMALIYERFARTRDSQTDAMREFLALRREAMRDVRSPLRLFGVGSRRDQRIVS